MWYKNSHSIGIRRKWGDQIQCITFGGKRAKLPEGVCRSFADDALKKLDGKWKEAAVKTWVDAMVKTPVV